MHRLLSVCLTVTCISCDVRDAVQETGTNEPLEPHSVAVVITSDYIDVYGTIVVEVDGQSFEIESTQLGNCADPILRVVPGAEFKARSANHFFWAGEVPSASGDEMACVTVSLDADGLKSGVSGVFQKDPECLPARVSVAVSWGDSGDEHDVGAIWFPWAYDPSEFEPLPFVDPTRFFLQMARLGRMIVIGGGPPSDYSGVSRFIRLQRRSDKEGCPPLDLDFPPPSEGRRLLWGLDPNDDKWDEVGDE